MKGKSSIETMKNGTNEIKINICVILPENKHKETCEIYHAIDKLLEELKKLEKGEIN